ncbi:hypothetical protein BDZ85DRAFT_282443 [Elsinoe ampelina]|uniref:Uncharacterized protein n=1 Tax=Elsinoe ampelina TaxID=302913 RepID=A0A6A6G9Z5_9PEZI|nr:hypothetical protein BDZ85DRAFT_282443 [Elsinoe ampelina]
MTSTTTSSQPQTTSPSPSPSLPPQPRPKHRKPRPLDPLQRTDTATLTSFTSPPSSPDTSDTLWTRTITAPLAFISFLFSLSYVDWRDRAWRIAQRGTAMGWWEWLPWNWGEPWQREDGRWDVGGQGGRGGEGKQGGESWNRGEGTPEYGRQRSWPIRKKLRSVARLEMRDAWAMRGVVSLIVVVGGLVVVSGMWLVGRWGWRKWSG